ncbi:prion-inhibition and propagation-domain-containing protein [Hyaloscypha sp. PMI_1271]|nr:prion-inhibition and propagation-domain-containing protein [Hyaloscypha sp. PMI_1271]
MSGAAEGIAGLALSAISVAALFTTCIECFDIIVAGKNFSEDYEQLCALFSLQRARFGLWGESVGLVPNPHGHRLRYDKSLDRPDIRPGVERVLNNIKSLLEEAGKVDERYGLTSNIPQGSEVSTSRGLDIFKGSFERFKSRIRKHQKETSAWKVTRWAIHDAEKFEGMLNRLKEFVDGLESITKSLGLLREQHERLQQEIESISDTQSLRLLRDASSRHGSSQPDVSDAASQRLITVAESFIDTQTLDFSSHFPASTDSFVTARSRPSGISESVHNESQHIPGAWPSSIKSNPKAHQQTSSTSHNRSKGPYKPRASCEQCLQEHYKCVLVAEGGRCSRCVQTQKDCSLVLVPKEAKSEAALEPSSYDLVPGTSTKPLLTQGLPQHQRLLSDILSKAKPRKPLSFAAGDAHYGERLASIKNEDEKYWLDHSGIIVGQAHSGPSAAKRMFFELRNIRAGKVPFVSAVPLDDSLAEVLASIEGPPETPYEGGVFFITVKLSETNSFGPPLMRFHTKIYHPNISPQGHICADYKGKWNTVLSVGSSKAPVSDSCALWYPPKSGDTRWSLGALLTAMCGLLASPDVDDPLVPEIAQKYIEDYNGYCENARLYTQRFATGARPEYQDLIFSEDISQGDVEMNWVQSNNPLPESATDAASLSKSLPPLFTDLAEGWASTNSFEASSIHLEADNLYMYINWRILQTSWKLRGRDRSETPLERQSKRIYSSVYLTPLLGDLILSTRNHLQPLVTRLEDKITDLQICHILLQAADRRPSGHFDPQDDDDLAASAFLEKAQNLCGDFLAGCLATGETKVQVLGRPASISYQISVTGTLNGYEIWNITKTLKQIKNFNAFLIAEFPDARLWGWDGTPVALDEPHPQVFALLFEHGLERVFRSHTVQLLKRTEFLSFVRPDFNRLYENPPAPLIDAPRAFRRVMPSISTLIQSFIHPSLMNGIGVSVVELTSGMYEDSARLLLENRDDGGANMRWVVKWHDGQRFSHFRNITRIVRGPSNPPTKSNILSMIYRRPIGRDQTTPWVSAMRFQSSEETEICFGALHALWQIDKLLRENADTGLPKDGSNSSDSGSIVLNTFH